MSGIVVFIIVIRAWRLLGFGPWGLQLSGAAGASAKCKETRCGHAPKDLHYPTRDYAGHRGRGKVKKSFSISLNQCLQQLRGWN